MMPEDTGSTETRVSTEIPSSPAGNATEQAKDTRDKLALELVDRLSLWSGAAGFIPVPIVDIAAVGGVQIHMLRRLSQIYGIPFSENRGKSVLTSVAGAVMPATTATAATSLIKGVPILGTAIGSLTMPAAAACATWVIGRVFIKHFSSGGTLLDFNPPDYREFIKSQKSKFAARSKSPESGSGPALQTSSETATTSETI
ncbi:MAG TPA: DUF697 domain-containing protein [Xanthobacteraceae bacterium]|jgi:uncharacterized protein (DUF697 family)